MKGVVITTKNKMYVQDFGEPKFEAIGKVVGGWIEVVHPRGLAQPFCMIVDEEGLLKGYELNAYGSLLYESYKHGNPIVGTIVILKEGFVCGERDFIDMSDEELEAVMQRAERSGVGITRAEARNGK